MPTTEAKIRVSDHSFGLFDQFEIPIHTADWSTGLVVEMASGAMIYTGIDRGFVHVTTEVLAAAPDLGDSGQWDDIVEATVPAPHGDLRIHQLEYGPGETPPPFPRLSAEGRGTYRLRAHARGRDRYFDKVCDDSGEEYLLAIWPAPPLPPLVIRATDHCGYGLRLANLTLPRRPGASPPQQPPADPLRQALLDATERPPQTHPRGSHE